MRDSPLVLLIEDQHDLASNIYEYLEACDYIMDAAPDGISGLSLACENDYDAILLDLELPGMDGVDVCARLRNKGRKDTPVIMITARDTLDDRLIGFDAGSDGYLVKPFDLAELEVRLQALIRRAQSRFRTELVVANLVFDTVERSIHRGDHFIRLTPACLKILEVLMLSSPKPVSRERLERALWGDELACKSSLRTHVYALRNAIDVGFDKDLIHTIHGYGYRIAE